MAIALDSSSRSGTAWLSGSPTSLTWAHTCTGSNLVLVVCFYTNASGDTVTGITYNGVAMTRAASQIHGSNNNTFIYYLINPSTGTNNIVASVSPGLNFMWGAAESLTGASQVSQPDSFNSGNTASATSLTVSTTVVAADSWLVGMARGSNNPAAGTGTTRRQDGTADTSVGMFDSNGTVASGSQSLQITDNLGSLYMTVVSIAPVPVATASRRLLLLGVGT